MQVSFLNFNDLHHEEFRAEAKKRISEIIDSNGFIEGKYNDSFEERFAKMQGAKFCKLVANGTDALQIALKVYGVKEGDKVAVAGISFFASAEAVINVGATPILVDVDPQTGLICLESFKRIIEKHDIKAVMPVHIYGQPAPIEELEKICAPKNIHIVEDGAQAQGGHLKNGPIGSSNNLTTFSFYPTKNLSAFGDAGAILGNDEKLADAIVQIRNHGRGATGHEAIGVNSRCDHIQAAILDLKLDDIEKLNENRKASAASYLQGLEGLPLRLPPKEFVKTSSWHLFPIGTKDNEERMKLFNFLRENEIGCVHHFYSKALIDEPTLSKYEGENEHASHFSNTTLCLPMHPYLKEEEVNFVCEKIQEFYKG